ncbi:Ribosomal protein L35 [Senna tora]|uniref:Ribosomal protein L35 n=1 Tax=Senna tora TaxID=362788 RepID=A0A834TVP8_9FABA|nr:Ribosomal protein L35 [Senna tora]
MMQRWCTKVRCLAVQSRQFIPTTSSHRLLHYSPHPLQFPSTNRLPCPLFKPSSPCPSTLALHAFRSSPFPPSLVQVRHVSSRERKKRRTPMTPVTSKLKKTKIKFYSSFKSRFRTLNDGTIRRWKEGKRHNAHLKSKKSKRRLRKPAIVPTAYAKVMKKLSFCG